MGSVFRQSSKNQSIVVVVGRTGDGSGDGTGTEGSTVRVGTQRYGRGNGTGSEILGARIWRDLVDDHGFPAQYASVRRFVVTLRGQRTPEAHPVIVTAYR